MYGNHRCNKLFCAALLVNVHIVGKQTLLYRPNRIRGEMLINNSGALLMSTTLGFGAHVNSNAGEVNRDLVDIYTPALYPYRRHQQRG